MGLYTTNSLNRVALIKKDKNDYDILEEEEKIEALCKKYDVEVNVKSLSYPSTYYFVIHNNKGLSNSQLYAGSFLSIPFVEDDETFLQRSDEFIKEASKFFKQIEVLQFGEPIKRMFITS